MSDGDSLYGLAYDVLSAAVAILGWQGRAYVSIGEPAYDCPPQMTVAVQRVEDGAVGPTAPGSGDSMSRITRGLGRSIWATMQIDLVDCVTVGEMPATGRYVPPSEAKLTSESERTYRDGWRLRNGLSQMIRAGDLLSACSLVELGIMLPITPEGGAAGWRIPLTAQLDGYDPL